MCGLRYIDKIDLIVKIKFITTRYLYKRYQSISDPLVKVGSRHYLLSVIVIVIVLKLMYSLNFAQVYIDDLLVLSTGTFKDHLDKLEQVLTRLQDAGLKVNASKCFFGKEKLMYLGYWITHEGINP